MHARPVDAATLSAEQTVYMITRAAHDAAIAEISRRAPQPGPDAPESEVDAWLDTSEAVRAELGVDALAGALTAAEDALLAWSFTVARREAGRSRRKIAAIDAVELGLRRPAGFAFRARALDLALRLHA